MRTAARVTMGTEVSLDTLWLWTTVAVEAYPTNLPPPPAAAHCTANRRHVHHVHHVQWTQGQKGYLPMLEPQQRENLPGDLVAHDAHSAQPPSVDDASGLNLPDFLDEPYDDDLDFEPKRPLWRRRWLAIVAALVVIALVAGAVYYVMRPRALPTTYQEATVTTGNLALTVGATGPVQAATYNLNFATSGQIAEIDVAVGQRVKAGQVLARLDATQLQSALDLAQNQANVAYDQEQAAISNCDTERNPPVDCVQVAENQYASVVAQLQTAQANLAKATLTANHAGVVTAINGAVGGTPGTGGSGSSASGFIQIVDPNSLTVTANVNEADVGGLASGQLASFTVSAFPGAIFHATVSTIALIGSSTSGVVTYPVTLVVDTTRLNGDALLTGMTATVTITRAQRINVLLVPASAITFGRAAANTAAGGFLTRAQVSDARTQAQQLLTTLQAQNPKVSAEAPTLAWVLERANNKWVVVPVVLGLTNGSTYEVLAGLNDGDSVVIGEQNGTISTTSSSGTTTPRGGGFGGGGFGGGGFGGGGTRGGAGG